MNIYIGNLARQTSEDGLRALFVAYGEVSSVVIIKDKFSGESRGFGFVEMPSSADAQSAIENLNETELDGRTLVVNESKPREDRRSGPGGGGERRGSGPRRSGPGGGGSSGDRRGGGGYSGGGRPGGGHRSGNRY